MCLEKAPCFRCCLGCRFLFVFCFRVNCEPCGSVFCGWCFGLTYCFCTSEGCCFCEVGSFFVTTRYCELIAGFFFDLSVVGGSCTELKRKEETRCSHCF